MSEPALCGCLPVPLHRHMNLEVPSRERVVFVVSPLTSGGQNPCSFDLQDEGLVDSF